MALSDSLVSQFAKLMKTPESQPETKTVTGTAKLYAGKIYVQLDGSDQLTPIASSTVGMKDGDRVTVEIKNHSASVTGNATDPAASSGTVGDLTDKVEDNSNKIAEFDNVIADVVTTDDLEAINANIENLVADNVTITGKLDAVEASIDNLEAENVTITGNLDAISADIDQLHADMLTADVADLKYATIENLEATNADIHNLEADYGDFKDLTTENFGAVNATIANLDAEKLDAEQAELHYANIDFANIGDAAIENFFAKSGMIGDLVVDDGHVTGTLVGVTIKGDLIEGGTVVADKLVILGDDGLYYKLNTNGESVSSEQTEYNSLNGSVITAKSITAEKVNVSDLVAFNATIGGYHITDSSLYSGVKSSALNTTRGVFMNDDGEFALGDSQNYLRFFKDPSDSQYKLDISAASIKLGASGQSIEDKFDDIDDQLQNVDVDVSVGGRNLILHSESFSATKSSSANFQMDVSLTDYGREVLQTADQITMTFSYSVPSGSTGVIKVIPRTSPEEEGIESYASTDYNESYMDPIPEWPSLSQANEGMFTYTIAVNETYRQNLSDFLVETSGVSSGSTVTLSHVKLEIGKTKTDWTPAPEDMVTGSQITDLENSLQATINRVSAAEIEIDGVNASISMLVTDENGSSMMTQTADGGWTFNMSAIQSTLDSVADQVDELGSQYGNVQNMVDEAQATIDSVKEIPSYVKITQTESGDPALILGRDDSEFKLQITNTEMSFLQGTQRIAYITNRKLYIQASTVTDELQIGDMPGYIWKRRENNHLGLRYITG